MSRGAVIVISLRCRGTVAIIGDCTSNLPVKPQLALAE
jgi:hypothetical protein